MASRPPKHPGPLLPRLESGRQLVAPEAEPSPSKLQLPALALPADEPDRRDEAFSSSSSGRARASPGARASGRAARGARHGARPTRAALHWTGEAVAVEAGAEGRPHSAALAVVADELELLGDAGIAVSAAAKQRLDGEAVAPPLGLFAQSGFAWTFLPKTRWAEGSRPAPLRGDRKTVVMATLAFDAKLAREAGSARLFVQRRRAVAVLQTALGCGGGERAPGSDALYVFDSVAAGLLAALDAKAALDKFVAQALVDVAAAGFGIAAGELVAAPGATTGACVAVAARLCHELAGRATPGGVLVDGPARGARRPRRGPRPAQARAGKEHKHVKVVATWLKGPGGQLDEFHQVYGSSGALYRETEASLKRAREDALRARRRRDAAKATRRADYGRGAATGGRKRQKGPQLDATCASALEELRAVTEPGDVEAALADWYRGAGKSARSGSKAFAPARRRSRKLRRKRETASDRIQTAFRVAPTMVKARARAKRAQKRTKAAFDAAKIGKFGRGWAKTASRALWPGARDVRAAKTPASALAVLVDAAGGRASRARVWSAPSAAATTPRPLAHHLDAIVDDLRHDGAQRERTDEEKAAGAAGIRARIQYLRSRCSDPAAIAPSSRRIRGCSWAGPRG
ncbi:hypothetical protein JL722_7018 [Aureococcus anophagefferens]|nr:hypothetical protein JL722_7018 [Aureococcus anophagefferens]